LHLWPGYRRHWPAQTAQAVAHWADPMQRRPGAINHGDGGRGVYFADPSHLLEVITRPYGNGVG
jgi:hypothetical protein